MRDILKGMQRRVEGLVKPVCMRRSLEYLIDIGLDWIGRVGITD